MICVKKDCADQAQRGRRVCGWHAVAMLPLADQLAQMDARRAKFETLPGYEYRARTARETWPAGMRWCSDCQGYVPLWFATGSKCKPHARQSARGGHVERTYGIARDEERALREWQQGRCFICGRRAVRRELAVDHDHATGAVRGLLCSDDEHGCNTSLRRLLGDVEAARRLLAYVEMTPLERYRAGEPSPFTPER